LKSITYPLLIFFSLLSCNERLVYSEYDTFGETKWAYKNPKYFHISALDTTYTYNGSLHFTILTDYPYRNIWFRYNMSDKKEPEQIQMTLATKQGKWLGKGGGRLRHYSLPLFQNKKLTHQDTFTFWVQQYMRVDTLQGIKSVGLEISKDREVF
tara:strand:- start:13852 stop:14313 length:462 start_codon:yes stop_codon:yes gene_type:complete